MVPLLAAQVLGESPSAQLFRRLGYRCTDSGKLAMPLAARFAAVNPAISHLPEVAHLADQVHLVYGLDGPACQLDPVLEVGLFHSLTFAD